MSVEAVLVTDILEQILVRLVVKDLIRFKSVCKSWYSLISDPFFAKAHLKRNNNNEVLRITSRGSTSQVYYHESEPGYSCFGYYYCRLVGSSNGLVCVYLNTDELFVANPLTREVRKLPGTRIPKYSIALGGFGYDSSTDDYKVVLGFSRFIYYFGEHMCFQVLTLKTNVWKDVGEVKCTRILYKQDLKSHRIPLVGTLQNEGTGTLCNGALHWLMNDQSNKHTILSFNLSKEEFTEIPLPAEFPQFDCSKEFPRFAGTTETVVFRHDSYLGIIQKCLCVFGTQKSWVMKRYNVKQSWEIYEHVRYDVPHLHEYMNYYDYDDQNPYMSTFGPLHIELSLTSSHIGHIYVESLVSPHVNGRLVYPHFKEKPKKKNRVHRIKFMKGIAEVVIMLK